MILLYQTNENMIRRKSTGMGVTSINEFTQNCFCVYETENRIILPSCFTSSLSPVDETSVIQVKTSLLSIMTCNRKSFLIRDIIQESSQDHISVDSG